MTKTRSTKKALGYSVLSLVLCISMLIGTTFAWFTDSVSSANNIITAGNLDVDVYYGDPAEEKSIEGISTLFNSVKLWEPGALAYENLTVVNKGTLALKYQMTVSFTNENHIIDGGHALSDILMIGLVEGGLEKGATREEAFDAASAWMPLQEFQLNGELLANTNEETIGIIIVWVPSDEDNSYNINNGKQTSDGKDHLHIDLGITLVATQLSAEEDSFDQTYDKDAKYPTVVGGVLAPDATDGLTLTAQDVSVAVPAGAPAGSYKLSVTDYEVQTDDNGKTTLNANIDLQKDGQKAEAAVYTVAIQLEPMLDVTSVLHKGEPIADFEYDKWTGVVSFTTTSFSPFAVEYKVNGTEITVDAQAQKITGGFFTVNPVTLDPKLLGNDSEYIAVDYVKDGVKYYAVSERATTIIVDDGNESPYEFENGDYTELVKTNSSGKLWSLILGLQNNAHSTVYILPGTYNEGTTINVYSSMDIIGLGGGDDVKVVKTSSSGSNRHLFNCNGTKADYIEVTLRDLYLDASAKTTNNKDNAAVQSIRKTKVKCYDLTVVKGSGWDAVAFYVNGNNAVDGVKYTAYLYAENCSLNTTRTFGIVTTSGSYKFYHSGITYNNGAMYTANSGSIKNQTLDFDDWDW